MSTGAVAYQTVQETPPIASSPHFKDLLTGENAFYNQPDYIEATQRDLASPQALPSTYTWDTEHIICRIARRIFSTLIFPIGIYQALHSFAGKIVFLPASTPKLMGLEENHANVARSEILQNKNWKYKRITIEVDGYKIDAMIFGKPSTLGNGRWMLKSVGNGQFYEEELAWSHEVQQILTKINGNGLIFNYPGVGASSGFPSRDGMVKAYHAMLTFLEDKENGIGAKEIIGYGHSIGGGVQGDALRTHELKKDIHYLFVKKQTFSNLATEAAALTSKPLLGFLTKMLGWNLDSVESSKNLKAKEIILQTAHVTTYAQIHDSSQIASDGVIPAEASLAKALLDAPEGRKDKLFIGIPENHKEELRNPTTIGGVIQSCLES